MTPEISVVIPLYNEAPNLTELYGELINALEGLNRTFELVSR